MTFKEKILFAFCKNPKSITCKDAQQEWDLDSALSLLCRVFPNFTSGISGKRILDFGCGEDYQAVAMAKLGAKYVLGTEIGQKALQKARTLAKELNLEKKVEFAEDIKDCFKNTFDIAISQNGIEHYNSPVMTLNKIKDALNQNGKIFITFGPPWFAPYGCHMQFFIKIPWANLLFDEKTVMNVRKYFRNDGAQKFEEIEFGLNKMSVSKFERIVKQSDLRAKYKKYECIKGLNFLSKIPLIRELFINHISYELIKNS